MKKLLTIMFLVMINVGNVFAVPTTTINFYYSGVGANWYTAQISGCASNGTSLKSVTVSKGQPIGTGVPSPFNINNTVLPDGNGCWKLVAAESFAPPFNWTIKIMDTSNVCSTYSSTDPNTKDVATSFQLALVPGVGC